MPLQQQSAGGGARAPLSSLVSVIIPTFNRGEYLVEALASVVDQTYRPLEIVVVDDGSEEGDLGLAGQWWETLPYTRREGCRLVLLQQANGGPSKARNRGLAEATGDFIQFLDSDDLLHPEKIERQAATFAARPELGYVYSSLRTVRIEGGELVGQGQERVGPASFDVGRHISLRDSLQTSVGLYRRETCERMGPWDESLSVGTDIEYNLRLILFRVKAAYVDGVFLFMRTHDGPRTSRGSKPAQLVHTFEALEGLLDEHATQEEMDAAGVWLAYAYCRVGFEALAIRQPDIAADCLARAWRYSATMSERIKVCFLGALVRAPLPIAVKSGLARRALSMAPYRRMFRRLVPWGEKRSA